MASGERAKLAAATARMEILRMISPESSEYVPIRHRPGDAMPAAFSRERRQQNRPASRKLNSVRRVSGQKGNQDRKSVVSGKSVQVRVDLGGRRTTNKNKPTIPPRHTKHN